MIDISKTKYPELDRAVLLRPGPQIVLGHEIYWTVKEDGSNIGCYLNDEGEVHFRSRNMDQASPQFYSYLGSTDEFPAIKELLEDAAHWKDEYVIFGELLVKGKSPTKTEIHEKTRFVVFDIWSSRYQRFMNYTKVHQECYHVDLPVVDLLGTCHANTLDSLWSFRDEMLDICKDLGKEGAVAKIWDDSFNAGDAVSLKRGICYFKEKLDTPKIEKKPRKVDDGKPQLPELPESEILGAIEKVRVDIGEEFSNVRIAMPMIADYVKEECRKHHCVLGKGQSLFRYYQLRLQELAE
jgi:hypothetical protein